MWQMWSHSLKRAMSHSREGVPQLWEEEPLDRDVSNKNKLLNWVYTITTQTTRQTEKAIGQQAIQAAGWRRRERQWQVLQKGTPNKHKKGGSPPKKTHLLKLVISEEENSVSNVGLSGPTHPPEEKYSLSGPPHPPKEKYSLQSDTGKPCSNPFICYALGNGNGSQVDDSNKKYRVYTDTDSDGKTEIITDINCKFKGKVFAMEIKVDPGSETNCIPLSHFRCLFPQLCKTDGLPKETALEPTLAQFEVCDGGIMQAHGWTIMPTQNISTKKFHPVRYYMVEREDAWILISHATASWLDLVRVLCTNKAPKCKRQVASVTKKLKEPPRNNSHFRTSTPSQREIFSDRTATPFQREIFSGTAHNNKIDMKKSTRAEEATSTSHSNGRK